MNRICALNSWESSDSDEDGCQEDEGGRVATKEAQEAEAFVKYNNALKLQKLGQFTQAQDELQSLLGLPLIQEVEAPDEDDEVKPPALILKYSTYKNLANLAFQDNSPREALEFYLQAVMLDATDVSVWYKMGCLAMKLDRFSLARHAFEAGLECNPYHWPCLDNVLTLLYALNNYEVCLCYIARALERDPDFIKGLAFLKKIFSTQPSLQLASQELFKNCDQQIYKDEKDEEEKEQCITEALQLRKRHQALSKVGAPPVISLPRPLKSRTWQELGESLIALYDYVEKEVENRTEYNSSNPTVSYSSRVDLSSGQDRSASPALSEPMEIDKPAVTSTPLIAQHASPTLKAADETTIPVVTMTTEDDRAEVQSDADVGLALPSATLNPSQVNLPANDLTSTPNRTTAVEASQLSDMAEMTSQQDHNEDGGNSQGCRTDSGAVSQDSKVDGGIISDEYPTEGGGISQESRTDDGITSQDSSIVGGIITQESRSSHLGISQGPKRRGQKRKRLLLEQEQDLLNKRRSARVRNACQRKEETVNYQEMLRKFLPPTLLECEEDEDLRLEPLDLSAYASQVRSSVASSTSQPRPPVTHLCEGEESEVVAWLCDREKNTGVVQLLHCYLFALAQRDHFKWPAGLSWLYIRCYDRLRTHIILPNYLCESERGDDLWATVHMCLVWCELRLDHWTYNHNKLSPQRVISTSPRRSPVVNAVLGPDVTGPYFDEDMGYLLGLSMWRDVLGEHWLQFAARVSWMKARFHVMENKKELATECFHRVREFLSLSETDTPLVVHLVNCQTDNIISTGEVEVQVECLMRCQSLEEVQRLYDTADYRAVIDTLIPTFSRQTKAGSTSDAPDRHAQLILLQDALLGVSDYKGCLLWGEISFNEAFTQYLVTPSSADKEQWSSSIIQLFMGLHKCLSEKPDAINSLPQQHLGRLVNNLLRLIDFSMDMPEGATEMAVGTVFPWIILYHLIEHEENKLRCLEGGGCHDMDECLPSAILLLSVAHDCLGRRLWCTHSNGLLLHFAVGEMLRLLEQGSTGDGQHPFHGDLTTMIEQCFYCLYNHPNRRTKLKHLVDHAAPQVPLTWEHAQCMFHYFKPASMPEYDSYKTSTVSAELENLLRRISLLIPSRKDTPCSVEGLSAYIEGSLSELPEVSPEAQKSLPVLDELYYLLADYYFKNKEQAKAIKFYMLDLCINPTRFDTWAGMALARASRLEQRLNSHELKPEWALQKQSVSTLRCFQRALQIEPSNTKLWIEYGSLAYLLHSHASRTLKLQSLFSLGPELISQASTNRKEMLALAEKAYETAGAMEGEELEEKWLQHYILGKVAEKGQTNPHVYLQHYMQALTCLHEDHAKYPKKITYYYSAPHLAVESLEMFYRVHVSIVKYLLHGAPDMSHDDSILDIFLSFTKAAADSPFAKGQEKTGRRDSDRSGHDEGGALQEQVPHTTCSTTPSQAKTSEPEDLFDTSQESVICLDSPALPSRPLSEAPTRPHTAPLINSPTTTTTIHPSTPPQLELVAPSPTEAHHNLHNNPAQIPPDLEEATATLPRPDKLTSTDLSEAFVPFSHPEKLAPTDLAEATVPFPHPEQLTSTDLVKATVPLQHPEKLTSIDLAEATVPFPRPEQLTSTDLVKATVPLPHPEKLTSVDLAEATVPFPRPEQLTSTDLVEATVPLPHPDRPMLSYQDRELPQPLGATNSSVEPHLNSITPPDETSMTPAIGHRSSVPDITGLELATPVLPQTSDTSMKDEQVATSSPAKVSASFSMASILAGTPSHTPRGYVIADSDPEKTDQFEVKKAVETVSMDTVSMQVDDEEKGQAQQRASEASSDFTSLPRKTSCVEEEVVDDKKAVKMETDVTETTADISDIVFTQGVNVKSEHDGDSKAPAQHTLNNQTVLKTQPTESTPADQDDTSMDTASKKACLMRRCVDAFKLCLSRFPQHYKALYRLAYIYLHSPENKNLVFCRDVLLGNRKWAELQHMSSPGLFQDRKHTNFFNGLWRIPIEEIDRSGSFATHLSKAIVLLFDLLQASSDVSMLLHIHNQLSRIPEQGKKYLRDSDRVLFAKMAFQYCTEVAERKVNELQERANGASTQTDVVVPSSVTDEAVRNKEQEAPGSSPTKAISECSTAGVNTDGDTGVLNLSKPGTEAGEKKGDAADKDADVKLLVQLYKMWQLSVRLQVHTDHCNTLLQKAFVAYHKGRVSSQPSVLEQAIQFCQQKAQLIKSTREKPKGDVAGSQRSVMTDDGGASSQEQSPHRSMPQSQVSKVTPSGRRYTSHLSPTELAAIALQSPNQRSAAAVHSIYETMLNESPVHRAPAQTGLSPTATQRSNTHSFYSKSPSYSPKIPGVKSSQIRKRSPYSKSFSQKTPPRSFSSTSLGSTRSPSGSTSAAPSSMAGSHKMMTKPGMATKKPGTSLKGKSPSGRPSGSSPHSSPAASLSSGAYNSDLMSSLGGIYLTPSQAASLASAHAQAQSLAQWTSLAAMGAIDPSMWGSLAQSAAINELAAAQMLGSGTAAASLSSGMLDYQMLLSAAAAESAMSSVAQSSSRQPSFSQTKPRQSASSDPARVKLATQSSSSRTMVQRESGTSGGSVARSTPYTDSMASRPSTTHSTSTNVVSASKVYQTPTSSQPLSVRRPVERPEKHFPPYRPPTSLTQSSPKAHHIQGLASKVSAGISQKVASGHSFVARPVKPGSKGLPRMQGQGSSRVPGQGSLGVNRAGRLSLAGRVVEGRGDAPPPPPPPPQGPAEVIDISCLSDDD